MRVLSRFFKRCITKLWLAGIALLVLIALCVSAIRAALPHFNQYQSQFSQYLLNEHQIHFAMNKVQATWQDGGPTLILSEPKFANSQRFGVDFSAQEVALQLNIPQSILALSPRLNWIEIKKAQVVLSKQSETSEPTSDPIPMLVNLVRTVDIDDALVAFDASFGQLPSVHLSQFRWLGGDGARQIQLALAANEQSSAPLTVLINLFGEDKASLYGSAYVNAVDWQWVNDFAAFLPPLASDVSAQASFELWADFSSSALNSMFLTVGDNQLEWLSHKVPQRLSVEPMTMHWFPKGDGWRFAAPQLQIALNEQKLQPLSLSLLNVDQGLIGAIDQLDLAPIGPITGLFAALNSSTNKLLSELAPTGLISNLSFEQRQGHWHYQGELTEYSQQQVGGIPAISALTGSFKGVDSAGQAALVFNQESLDFGPYFKQPIAVKSLSSELYWGADNGRSWFGLSRLSGENADLNSELAFELLFEQGRSPALSLYGEASLTDATQVDKYLPHVVLSDGLVGYLSQAIQGGHSDDIGLLWQGELAQFPYQNNNGVFEVNARVKGAQYQFHQDWLPLSQADVSLNFRNASMLITGHSGRLKQLEFEALTTRIDNLLENPAVVVDVELNQSQSKINDFVFASVIDDSVGAVLRQLDVQGDVRTNLMINIPLDDANTVVSGSVLLNNNDLAINAIDLAIDKVSGTVSFVNGDVIGQDINGLLFEQPVNFAIKTKPMGTEFYGIELDLQAQWHSEKIPQSWRAYLDSYLTGSLDWQGRVTLKIGKEDVSYQANFKSPMQGLELKLPKPLNKYVDHQESLSISTSGDVNGGQFNMALGSRAEVLADFSTQDNDVKVEQLSLIVGRGFNASDTIADDGLSIKIDLDTLKLDEWQAFVNSLEKEQAQAQNNLIPSLKYIQANVKRLSVLGQHLNNVLLVGHKMLDNWTISVDSPEAIGELTIYDDFLQRGIAADFKRLIVSRGDEDEKQRDEITLAELLDLPLIDFSCQQCQIAGVEVGALSFNTQRQTQGLAINDIKIKEHDAQVSAKGFWGFDQRGQYSQLSGKLESENLENTLKLFDSFSGIKDSGVKTSFDLRWRDSIYNPTLNTLDGNVQWSLSEGHIAEVSDKGARIFSLFSLDSLRRKLVLDFRDVFVKGIFYNNFKGEFAIGNGVAVTHDAHMDGIAAGIDVVGSINLVSQELDYYVTVTPNLFSNIPVIAGVVTSTPQVFVLAFALTKVLDPIIDVISQVNFKLSGTVDEPEFVEVNRKQKKYKVPAHILPKPEIIPANTKSNEQEPPQIVVPNTEEA